MRVRNTDGLKVACGRCGYDLYHHLWRGHHCDADKHYLYETTDSHSDLSRKTYSYDNTPCKDFVFPPDAPEPKTTELED